MPSCRKGCRRRGRHVHDHDAPLGSTASATHRAPWAGAGGVAYRLGGRRGPRGQPQSRGCTHAWGLRSTTLWGSANLRLLKGSNYGKKPCSCLCLAGTSHRTFLGRFDYKCCIKRFGGSSLAPCLAAPWPRQPIARARRLARASRPSARPAGRRQAGRPRAFRLTCAPYTRFTLSTKPMQHLHQGLAQAAAGPAPGPAPGPQGLLLLLECGQRARA